MVEAWEYIGPDADEEMNRSLLFLKGTRFGPEQHEVYILWREGGFDLSWLTFPCSTQPILVLDEAAIELWSNEGIWDDCDSMGAVHGFKVEVETSIPPDDWTYALHEGVPPLEGAEAGACGEGEGTSVEVLDFEVNTP